MNQGKRVYCLYRVSTKGQVDKDDIPMQKQVCREFAERNGWEIVKEYYEKGISGFKISSKDRDAIQDLQKEAALGKFDILLVFMFDRLGRRDDETPFVVEWFSKNGIEVWSTQEGEQRFDNHVDKLMNYIRYWQASGESIKTSIRTKTRLGQIVQEGRYRGGNVSFGYRLEKCGRFNKRNHEVYDIKIDEDEAAIIQHIFNKYVNEGYGSQRISTFLAHNQIMNRQGNNFTNTTIQHMLKNRVYLGILKSGETESEIFPDLQIIDPQLFERAQNLLLQRSKEYKDKRTLPLNTKGQALLSGNLFCGHCGARLTLTTSVKTYTRRDGSVYSKRRVRYACYNRTRHPHLCDGQSGYLSEKVDGIVENVVLQFFRSIGSLPKNELIERKYQEKIYETKACLKQAQDTLAEYCVLQEDFEREMIKVIRGTSKFSSERLERKISETEQQIELAKETVSQLTEELENTQALVDRVNNQYEEMMGWADLYHTSSMEVKKMIIGQLIHSIRVSRDYKIEIDFNISYSQFHEKFYCEKSA